MAIARRLLTRAGLQVDPRRGRRHPDRPARDPRRAAHDAPALPARDLVDVRLAAAIDDGGCAICVVRARGERGMLDSIIAERVLDIGFREGLERDHALLPSARRRARRRRPAVRPASSARRSCTRRCSTAGSSPIRGGARCRGRRRRSGWPTRPAGRRAWSARKGASPSTSPPPARRRTADPAWAAAAAAIPFCLDDLVLVVAAAGDAPAAAPVIDAQLARLEDLRARLEGFADHSAQDRRHLMTDEERRRCRRGRRALGGRQPDDAGPGQPVAEPVLGRDLRLARRDRVELEAQVADGHPEQVDVARRSRRPRPRRAPADG